MRTLRLLTIMAMTLAAGVAYGQVTLVADGKSTCAIYVPARVMAEPTGPVALALYLRGELPELQRVRLRDSVRDLAACLEQMSGAPVEIIVGPPAAGDARIPIRIAEYAQEAHGDPRTVPGRDPKQTGRLLVDKSAVGIWGATDLATSYAIYELLDGLGCRWYLPSDVGAVIPESRTITLKAMDRDVAPATLYRGIWYCDLDYARRNRMGGIYLSAGHALESYVPADVLAAHPEWRAQDRHGKSHGRRLKWSQPGVAETMAASIIALVDKAPDTRSVSLSPDDGLGFDETDDRTLDAGDFDPSTDSVSTSDRLIWLSNRIVSEVEKTHPGIKYGVLAYGPSTRAPVRIKPHPDVVPQIAPITFTRAHPMTDDGEPNNAAYRELVRGWAKVSPQISYYFYGWFLAEPSAPNPFITKWSVNAKFVYDHGNCAYWQPETMPNFETTMHGLYLGLRLAWDPAEDPAVIIDELHATFYGAAAAPMAAYWHYVDRVWTDVPEYAGCGFGHLRRWTPEHLQEARRLLDIGREAAATPMERRRVQMADDSLGLFEMFMGLRRDLAEGRFADLDLRADAYYERSKALGVAYAEQYAFTGVGWSGKHGTVNGMYFKAFYDATYRDAATLAKNESILTPPLRQFRYQADKEKAGEELAWMRPDLDDSDWKTTDTCVDTWSALGLHNYMGTVWYRTTVDLAELPKDQTIHLWIGATDGSAKVYVNGVHCPWTDTTGAAKPEATGYAAPKRFTITQAVQPGKNQITIRCERLFINELGTGGILSSPVVIYASRVQPEEAGGEN